MDVPCGFLFFHKLGCNFYSILWVYHLFDSVGESFCGKIVFFSGNMIFINLFIRVFKPKKVVCSSEFKVKITLNFEKLTLCTPCSFAHSLSMYLVEFMCVYLSHPPSASFILFLGTCRQRRRRVCKSGGVGGNNRAFLLCHTMTDVWYETPQKKDSKHYIFKVIV